MKKLALSLFTVFSLANADFIGASVGAGMWQENISGYVKTGNNINYFNNKSAENDGNSKTGNLGLADKKQPYVWAKIIHPIPIIPNVKLQYTKYETSGTGIATANLKIFGQSIDVNDRVHTDLKIDSYDATFFYEIKPVVVDLEVGVGVNVLKGEATLQSTTTQKTASGSFTAPLPYLYARAESTPVFGLSVEAQAKYLNVSIGHYYDYQGAIKYHLPLPILDVSLSVGYKSQDIFGKDGDNETAMKFKGGFAELGVKW
jgi:outer membrane protein